MERGMSARSYLLDGNVLVALHLHGHVHHERVLEWMSALKGKARFATCAVTEGTLLRLHMAHAKDQSAKAAWEALANFRSQQGHEFWEEKFSYAEVEHGRLQGHRQVTDAWLVELARRKGGKLATLDAGLAVLHPEVAEFVRAG